MSTMQFRLLSKQCTRACRFPRRILSRRLFCTSSTTPIQLLQNKINAKEIKHDENQVSICNKLTEIHSNLCKYNRLQNINEYDTKIIPLFLDTETNAHFDEMQTNKSTLNLPSSLYMFGDVGNGKTMLLDLFYESCPDKESTLNTQKCRIHFNQFMKYIHLLLYEWREQINVSPDHYENAKVQIHENPNNDNQQQNKDENQVNLHRHRITKLSPYNGSENNENSQSTEEDIYRGPDLMQMVAKSIASEIYLLCFDEIQITDSANLSLISYLFSYLYQYGVVIVGTSNRNPNELFYGHQDEINHHLLLKPFLKTINIFSDVMQLESNNDYRKLQIDESMNGDNNLPYFIVSEDEKDGNEKLNALWLECIQNDIDGIEYDNNELIQLYGRKVNIKKYHLPSKSVYFTFAEICERLHGPYDYMYIANKFENIFIESIPSLSIFTQKNEARRFIWCIDAIYEAKSKLYCSSKRELNDLFSRKSKGLNENEQGRGSMFDDYMYKETMSDYDFDDLTIKNEGDERIQQVAPSNMKNANVETENEGSAKNLINSSIFSGEDEIFAFQRAISRIYEINGSKYRKESEHCSDSINVEIFNNLKIPQSVPPRNEKFGLSISEQLMVIPRRMKRVEIKDSHYYADWGQKGSGLSRTLRERFFARNRE